MKKMRCYFLSALSLSIALVDVYAQNVGINSTGASPDASAILDISSADKGLLAPRVALTSTAVAAPVSTPATSLLVYNTNTAGDVTPGFYYWDGSAWIRLINQDNASGGDWSLTGNAGTTPGTHFLGTTDAQDLVIKTNNVERIRVESDGALLLNGANGATPTSGAGTRMMWIPAKAAFRAGKVTGTDWDDASIGANSVAFGLDSEASGAQSMAGPSSTASGAYSTGLSRGNASGSSSTAIGVAATASGNQSFAVGGDVTASGVASCVFNFQNAATGNYCFVAGRRAYASADYGVAIGNYLNTNGYAGAFCFGGTNSATNVLYASASNQMNMRFQGGYRLYSNSNMTIGVALPAGGNSWAPTSDSTKKKTLLLPMVNIF